MRYGCITLLGLLLPLFAISQTPSQAPVATAQATQPPDYSNYSIMLVRPSGGNAVVLMHNPKNEIVYVDVNKTKEAFAAGYVPVRAAEIGEVLSALKEENARLASEVSRLQSLQQPQATPAQQVVAPPPSLTPEERAARLNAQAEAEKEARRQRMIQTWLLLQNMNRPTPPYVVPMPVNPNFNRLQTNCTSIRTGNIATTNCN